MILMSVITVANLLVCIIVPFQSKKSLGEVAIEDSGNKSFDN